MRNFSSNGDVPLGLGMALAQNVDALNNFAMLSSEKKMSVIEKAGNISSKGEMQSFVSQIADGNTGMF